MTRKKDADNVHSEEQCKEGLVLTKSFVNLDFEKCQETIRTVELASEEMAGL